MNKSLYSMSQGLKIKELRKQNKLTQEDLADAVGVSRNTVASWESGEKSPTNKNLETLADVLNVTIDVFLVDQYNNWISDSHTQRFIVKDIVELENHINTYVEFIEDTLWGAYAVYIFDDLIDIKYMWASCSRDYLSFEDFKDEIIDSIDVGVEKYREKMKLFFSTIEKDRGYIIEELEMKENMERAGMSAKGAIYTGGGHIFYPPVNDKEWINENNFVK